MNKEIKVFHIYDAEINELPIGLEKLYITKSKVGKQALHNINQYASLDTIYLDSIELENNTNQNSFNSSNTNFSLFKIPFGSNSQIRSLSLVNCRIANLTGLNLLQYASKLQMLSLAGNKLKTIDNNKFFPTIEIALNFWHLDLSNNVLVNLKDFKIPSTIKHLNLANNQLVQLNYDNFNAVWSNNLNEFFIEGLYIYSIFL